MIKSVCAVIVTHNRLSLLKECIEAILCQTKSVKNIVIVDSASTDGTAKYLSEVSTNNSKVYVKRLTENIGGAGGFNIGIKEAYYKTQCEFFWIMDDDTIPKKEALEKLMNASEQLENKFGLLCSNVRWTNGEACNIPPTSFDWSKFVDRGLIKITNATFVSILFSRNSVKKVGFPIAPLFIWGDDTEYTKRLNQVGNSYFVNDSVVIHKTKNNLTNITIHNDSVDRIKRYFYMYRNLIFISKKYETRGKTFKIFIRFMLEAVEIIFSHDKNKRKRSLTVLKGTFSGIFFNPVVEKVNDL